MPSPDIEVGRLALRSFKFVVVPFHGEGFHDVVAAKLGHWDDGTLKFWQSLSYHNDNDWLDGTCTATCGQGKKHRVPCEKCSCGIYGSLSYADLLYQYRAEARNIVTVIAAEGATIIGPRGLRTERARVLAYWVTSNAIYQQVAGDQFNTASVFETPVDLLDFYNLPALPKRTEQTRGGTASSWWTGKLDL